MAKRQATRRTCPAGHTYMKSTDCPTCPTCEKLKAPDGFVVDGLSAPARRALQAAGITSMANLARWREADLLALHGIGPSSLPKLRAALASGGLKLKA